MLERKTALVTGCSPGGIGHALALELHGQGLKVFATARTLSKIDDLKELGIHCVRLMVDDPKSVAACRDEVVTHLDGQGLNYLVNNAGQSSFRPATESDLDGCKLMFGANIFGVIDMCQNFLPQLIVGHGTIVNVGSVAGNLPLPFMSTYCASKAALYAYTESLRIEVAPLGVKATYVQTGNVKSHTMDVRYHLDESSLWFPVRDTFDKQQETAATTGWPATKFAQELVQRILARHKDVIWVGEGALACRIVSALEWYLPFKLWAFAFSRQYGMGRIKV